MWVDDESGTIKCEASKEFTVGTKDEASMGTPSLARWSEPLASGQYFEVEVQKLGEMGCFLGVTSDNGFAKGWACKGLFFGGNLSDGGGLVRQEFGDWIAQGMKIGVLAEFDDKSISVTYYQDGRCLGPAFAAKRRSACSVYPVVQADSTGDQFAISFPPAPAQRSREPKGGGKAHPAEGRWSMKRLAVGPELAELPLAAKMEEDTEVTLKVAEEAPGTFSFAASVVNHLGVQVTSTPDESLAPFDRLTSGPVRSTMMMGPEGMMEVEAAVSQGLESLNKWLAKEDQLLLVGPAVEMAFVPQVGGEDALPATEVELP